MLNKDQMVALIMRDVASHFIKLQFGHESVDIMGIFPSFHNSNGASCTWRHGRPSAVGGFTLGTDQSMRATQNINFESLSEGEKAPSTFARVGNRRSCPVNTHGCSCKRSLRWRSCS